MFDNIEQDLEAKKQFMQMYHDTMYDEPLNQKGNDGPYINIIHLDAKISENLCRDLIFYKVNQDVFMKILKSLANSDVKDQMNLFYRVLAGESVGLIVLDEKYCVANVDTHSGVKTFKITNNFYDVLDILINNYKLKLQLTAGYDRYCKELLQHYTYFRLKNNRDDSKIPVVRGRELNTIFKRLDYIPIDRDLTNKIDGLTGKVIKLYKKNIKAMVLWEETKKVGIWTEADKFIVFETKDETYEKIRNILWPDLQAIVEDEINE